MSDIKLIVEIPTELKRDLKVKCVYENKSIKDVIIHGIKEYLLKGQGKL